MFRSILVSSALAIGLVWSSMTIAQDLLVPESAVEAKIAASIPGWWRLDDFAITSVGDEELSARPASKVPSAASMPTDPMAPGSGKPGAITATGTVDQVASFSASLSLVREIYEPLYSMEGAAFVMEIMGPGANLGVTGTIGIIGSGSDATFSAVTLDQVGLEAIGKPLDEFEQPAFVQGSEEAEAYLAEQAAARAEGTINKLLSEEGDEL